MRDPFAGYDQWKTASPYDDQPDPIDDAQRFLDADLESLPKEQVITWAKEIIEQLLEDLDG